MSIYGALNAAVSGISAQSNALGIIADNVANSGTIAYKAGSSEFQTLVTSSGGANASYSPGGVLGGNRQTVSKQGLLQSTDSPTDIAISGSGFFVVNQSADSTGQVLYTRAGSFIQDATGNFRNAGGFYLQAWPLDHNGLLPGAPGNTNTTSSANLSSLKTVNAQDLTGVAASTTDLIFGANLKAGEKIFPGTGITAAMDNNDPSNKTNKASDIIIPQGTGNIDSLTRGDAFNIATGTSTLGTTFTYGGFSVGRKVSDGSVGDSNTAVIGGAGTGATTLLLTPFGVANNSNVVTVRHASHGLVTGDVVHLSGNVDDVGNIPAADLIGDFVITKIDANNYSIEVAGTNTSGVVAANSAGTSGAIVEDARPFATTGQILDAATAQQTFLGTTGVTGFVPAALSFTMSTLSTGVATFTYKASSPNAQAGEFNNMNTLVDAINAVDGLTARIGPADGRLYVGAIDAQQAITFANGSKAGIEGADPAEALYGIDWINELGLANVTAASDRYSTMQGLADLVNQTTELNATISSAISDASLFVNVKNPLDTVVFTDGDYNVGTPNIGSPLAALGFLTSLGSGTVAAPTGSGHTTTSLGPAYDPLDGTKNMASGSTPAQFERSVQVFDSLGTGHALNLAFIKTAANKWAVEVYAINASEVTATNGLLASGNVVFNGDGSLQSVSAGLLNPITINWATNITAPQSSSITVDWGTAGPPGTGKTNGLTQFDSDYNVHIANQNGAQVGQLTSLSIGEDGILTAGFSNGQTQALFKLPLAQFASPNLLQAVTGNAYSQTAASGEVNLSPPGSSGVGKIAASSLEASNVELADQLTAMIIAQRSYQANTKVISTADSLLNTLTDIIR